MKAIVFTVKTKPIETDTTLEELYQEQYNNIEETYYRPNQKIEEMQTWHPSFSRTLGIGVVSLNNNDSPQSVVLSNNSEVDLLKEFSEGCRSFNGPFVSYDGLWFDVPFLLARYSILGIDPPNSSFCNQIKFRSFPHYDINSIYGSWGRFPTSLSLLSHTFGIKYDEPASYPIWLKEVTVEDVEKLLLRRVQVISEIYLKMRKVFI